MAVTLAPDYRLLIKSIPSLKEAELCPFLENMNEVEKAVQGREQTSYNEATKNRNYYENLAFTSAITTVASGAFALAFKISAVLEKAFLEKVIRDTAIAGLIVAVFPNTYSESKAVKIITSNSTIFDVDKLIHFQNQLKASYNYCEEHVLPLAIVSAGLLAVTLFFLNKVAKFPVPNYHEVRWARLDTQLKQIKAQIASSNDAAEKQQLYDARLRLKWNKLLFAPKQ